MEKYTHIHTHKEEIINTAESNNNNAEEGSI